MWTALIPLIVGSAVVPIQIVVTVLLLRTSRATALAWVAGMTTVRLAQGVVFGLILSSDDISGPAADDGPGLVVAILLLVVAIVLLTTAIRELIRGDDPDAPPPRWLTATATMTPGAAFGLGAVLLAIGAKFWVFTLSATAVIGDAELPLTGAILTFLAFVVLAESPHVALLAVSLGAPRHAASVLERVGAWLQDHNRGIVIAVGFVFGAWFAVMALDGLGVP